MYCDATEVDMTRLVTVFGGSGFVGRHVVRALAKQGWRVRVAVRRPDLAGHLQPMGGVGQIMPVQANLRYPDSVVHAVEGADAVVNLVGILAETGRQSFDAVQAEGARSIGMACARAGIGNVVHVSALGADKNSESAYARSKWLGEAAMLMQVPTSIILRPSIIFGPEDNFFNQFAGLARVLPVLPLIGGGITKFQPVFVGDVAEAVATALDGRAKSGAVYEIGGPAVWSFKDILAYILAETGRKRALVPVPFSIAAFQGRILENLPGKLLTRDQVTLLKTDNIVSDEAIRSKRTLEGLGIKPETVEAIVPSYLYRFRKAGQFDREKAA
jgi:uncharacterized protein YbjT (DUF2867 family)